MLLFSTFVDFMSTIIDKEFQQRLYIPPMNLGGRIAKRLKELGWSQTHLLDCVPDMGAGTLSATILRDAKKSQFAPEIAKALHVRLDWLLTGNGPMQDEESHASDSLSSQLSNTAPAPEVVGRIPLISWVRAGRWCGVADLFEPGDAEAWLPTLKRYSRHAFALRVVGDSMVSPYPGQRSYPPGTILYIDPDRAVENGSRVIAKLPDENEATFKCYREDGGKRYLVPLNPQYPTVEITPAVKLCGVVVAKYEEE